MVADILKRNGTICILLDASKTTEPRFSCFASCRKKWVYFFWSARKDSYLRSAYNWDMCWFASKGHNGLMWAIFFSSFQSFPI